MNKFKNRPELHTLLEDETGGYSTTRVLRWVWFLPFIGLIVFLTIKKAEFPAIPENYMFISLGFLGFGVASKFVEKKPLSEMMRDQMGMASNVSTPPQPAPCPTCPPPPYQLPPQQFVDPAMQLPPQ